MPQIHEDLLVNRTIGDRQELVTGVATENRVPRAERLARSARPYAGDRNTVRNSTDLLIGRSSQEVSDGYEVAAHGRSDGLVGGGRTQRRVHQHVLGRRALDVMICGGRVGMTEISGNLFARRPTVCETLSPTVPKHASYVSMATAKT